MMKNVKNTGVSLIFSIVTLFSWGQQDTWLWSISGNGLKDTSYLFGTYHVICEEDFSISEKVQNAFNSSSAVAFELNMNDPAEMIEITSSMTPQQPISEQLTTEQLAELDELLMTRLNIPLAAVDAYGLMLINLLFLQHDLACGQIKSYEHELLQMAVQTEKKIIGLEKVKEQLAFIDSAYSIERELELLSFSNQVANTVDAYLAEDVEHIESFVFKSDYMNEREIEWILKERNANWIAPIEGLVRNNPTFVAVGAAHLLSDIGIIQLLRNQGYIISPVN